MSIKNFSILVAIDGSESSMKAVDYAIELAKKQDNSRLAVLNILDIDTAKQVSSSIITAPTYGLEDYELHKKAVLEWLDAIKKKCENEGIQTEIKVIGGPSPVPDSIIIYAENENVDLIVVGTRGRSGFKKLLLGSVASKVVTYAHCPVPCSKVKMKPKLNKEWHQQHRMPKNPTLDQRIEWHLEHQKNCSCRPIASNLLKQIRRKGFGSQ